MKLMGREKCPITGKLTEYYYRASDDKLVMREVYPNTAIMEANKRDKNQSGTWRPMKDGGVAARIPLGLVHQWHKQGINVFDQNDWKKVKQMLNSRDYSGLRTMNGRI